MTLIANTQKHVGAALVVEGFSTDGSARLVPIRGDKPGQPFILDNDACTELIEALMEIKRSGIILRAEALGVEVAA